MGENYDGRVTVTVDVLALDPEMRVAVAELLAGVENSDVPGGYLDARLTVMEANLGVIMAGIQNLIDAVNNQQTSFAEALTQVDAAFEELASDIRNLGTSGLDAAAVEAEANRIAANTEATRTALAGISQRLRDAVPTAPAEDPLPPVEEPVDVPVEPAPTDTATGGGPPAGGETSGTETPAAGGDVTAAPDATGGGDLAGDANPTGAAEDGTVDGFPK